MILKAHHKSICVPLGWLGQFSVIDHLVLECDEYVLEGVLVLPVAQNAELGGLNLNMNGRYDSVALVDAGQVHLGDELHLGWLFGVVGAALELQADDSVVEVGLG